MLRKIRGPGITSLFSLKCHEQVCRVYRFFVVKWTHIVCCLGVIGPFSLGAGRACVVASDTVGFKNSDNIVQNSQVGLANGESSEIPHRLNVCIYNVYLSFINNTISNWLHSKNNDRNTGLWAVAGFLRDNGCCTINGIMLLHYFFPLLREHPMWTPEAADSW